MEDAEKKKSRGPRELTNAEMGKLNAWIQKYAKDGNGKTGALECQVCHTIRWAVAPEFVEIHPFYEEKTPFTALNEVYPMVMMRCRNCSHVILLNAMSTGVMEDDAKKEAGDGK